MNKNDPEIMESRLRYFVGVVLTSVLAATILVVLYSLIFVTQPMGPSSENDKQFFALLTSISTFILGALGGVMAAGNNRKSQPPQDDGDPK
jgi:hypothetical protein